MALKHLCILTITCLLPSTLIAKSSYTFEDSVMMPGSRLVAGDLTKNEFFILDKNESQPSKPIVTIQAENDKTKRQVPQIKTVLKQVLQERKAKAKVVAIVPQVKTAAKQKTFIPVIKKYEPVVKIPVKKVADQTVKLKGKKLNKMAARAEQFAIKLSGKQLAAATAKKANYKVTKVKNKPKVKVVSKDVKQVAYSPSSQKRFVKGTKQVASSQKRFKGTKQVASSSQKRFKGTKQVASSHKRFVIQQV